MIRPSNYKPQIGDVFACWGVDTTSRAISLETSLLSWLTGPSGLRWSPSHVAIACPRQDDLRKTCYWFESTTMADRECLEYGERVSGVQVHQIADRIHDYTIRGGTVCVYRTTDIDSIGGQDAWDLRRILLSLTGQPGRRSPIKYDTAGAFFSGTRVISRLPFSRADLNRMFCSELIAAVLQRLGRMNRENPARYNPGLLLRRLVRQGTYGLHTQFCRTSDICL